MSYHYINKFTVCDLSEIEGESKLGFSFILYPTIINGSGWSLGLFWVLFFSLFFSKRGRWQMKQYLVNMFVDALKQ